MSQIEYLEHKIILERDISPKLIKPALFLDRDGVIIKDKNYISKAVDVELCQGIKAIIKQANKYEWPIIIVTNQSGISRGLLTWSEYEAVTEKMLFLLGNCKISGIYANGYGPKKIENKWRKPNPYMLLLACKDFQLDIKNSIIIGDRFSDILAGSRAKLKTAIHLLSNHGEKERIKINDFKDARGYFVESKHKMQLYLIDSLQDFPIELLKEKIH